MHTVYIIKSKKTGEIYIGYTPDLKRRLHVHNSNRSHSTKGKGPWVLVYAEAYLSKDDAVKREQRLKYYGRALAQLKRRIKASLLEAQHLK